MRLTETAGEKAPRIGVLASGPRGTLADIEGVTVGHCTLDEGAVQTGVTVIRPHPGDPFIAKVPAAASVINGFGKSIGLVQVEELGVLETPIALTNTFGVAAVAQAQIRAAIRANPQIGREWSTVNPLVFECNDGYLNDIQALAVSEQHYNDACDAASVDVASGSVGAGRGMSCFDLKGGIGNASRVIDVAGRSYTVGALVLANFGRLPMLTIDGAPLGRVLAGRAAKSVAAGSAAVATSANSAIQATASKPEQGSIIMIVATDAPLDARQLKRLSLRAAAGLARTGSVYGHGSGDIALAFSTAYTVPHESDFVALPPVLADARLDPLFRACADSVEQAIVDALWHATSVTGRDGHRRLSLRDTAPDLAQLLKQSS
ncbi:P1 family peptidase [Paraburkholderia domus]|jgi:D-aminopeptidase|uniref:Beta-peptidyl aminopeptidase BapA n=1 Tax=Paraburkholderia domus TaxID=2793075 RepID=A0A9N8QXZ8_9BURK|nr:P1 family peptidase [Paraburkholderia domus]MBK5059182.1 P1 family peptidase [Burkholderia sp. R-70199]MBK5163264.1 P1 family peptidase [Burkholderia sp. R-70211]CAE6864197.1 Beta-peptidyl aminopeptidase BapA [Paraburkholderia domus]CAE6877412.1 Beta-peptidyl aminopeptidase BapA [Paraburkholderia domus]CAE6946627.1 Beta-peptidyl aminopeptidase BapA [Paraburkholderia domus]